MYVYVCIRLVKVARGVTPVCVHFSVVFLFNLSLLLFIDNTSKIKDVFHTVLC